MTSLPFADRTPEVHPTAWIAPNASMIGKVKVDEQASVWFGAVLRGDIDEIVLGPRSNLQDNVVVHTEQGSPAIVGADVSVGHGAVVHGCTIEDGCLIGMNATVLTDAVVGAQSLVAAGAVVLEGTVVPPRSLVAGVPGKVRRELTDDEVAAMHGNSARYVTRARAYADQGRAE
ncbi:gamma carbonic anhydrase family protein [Isoptericola sp. b441]|uniref:Gamma carbonic anhydrase family protein n=1 Tax=Actinotalea lenta TaxID=3064654 RepID=A0ABT9DAT3_9CELL|nr:MULTISPECIES: gamma carbonic anhydrase family protein [unclassified Isoptericola]MDO8106406.1 gamma carbonic anhydrase family protein [Isoptericola sp. b441]MDO8121889.1 gamma carbonic anhydrase family protein [Isoptericola sp. b490]